MKRRAFLQGAAAAPLSLGLPDLFRALLQEEAAPEKMPPARPDYETGFFLNGKKLTGLIEVRSPNSNFHSISVTHLGSDHEELRLTEYGRIECVAYADGNYDLVEVAERGEVCAARLCTGGHVVEFNCVLRSARVEHSIDKAAEIVFAFNITGEVTVS